MALHHDKKNKVNHKLGFKKKDISKEADSDRTHKQNYNIEKEVGDKSDKQSDTKDNQSDNNKESIV